jgi:hypothetical protein
LIDQTVVEKYFILIGERRISEAERELQTIREKSDSSQWEKGYMKALEGLLLTQKSASDKYIYLARINLNEESAKKLKMEFTKHASNELHGEYDRGYFKALSDYVDILEKNALWNNKVTPTAQAEIEIEEKKETEPP